MYLLYILESSIEFISRSGDGCFIVYEYSWEWLCYLYFCQGNTVVVQLLLWLDYIQFIQKFDGPINTISSY